MEWTDGWGFSFLHTSDPYRWERNLLSFRGRGEVVSTILLLLASTGLLCLASVFYPCTQAHARNVLHVDKAMFGMDNIIHGFGSVDAR